MDELAQKGYKTMMVSTDIFYKPKQESLLKMMLIFNLNIFKNPKDIA